MSHTNAEKTGLNTRGRKGELPSQSLHFGDSMSNMGGKQKQYYRIWGTESAGKEGGVTDSNRAIWESLMKGDT